MKVLIFKTEGEAKLRAAKQLRQKIQDFPQCVLGLATGGTMEAVYAQLIEETNRTNLSWSRVTTFNLDEYWGISADSPASYRSYMNTHLFHHIDIDLNATHIPASNGCDPVDAATSYEAEILAVGGIDLQLLGIGMNGHIGFNEPTSSLASATRIKTLTENTRLANMRFFDRFEDVPKYALTVGIGTILNARECLIIGTGKDKAGAVRSMIEGPVSASCPASALQLHCNVTVVLDELAASQLELRGYYETVHPGGQDRALEDA